MLVPKVERQATSELEEFFKCEEEAIADIFGTKPDLNKNDAQDTDSNVSNEDSNTSLVFVKPEYLEEEAKVKTQNEVKAKDDDKEDEELRELSEEERYTRLMDLLNKSQFYSKYLLDRIQGTDEETKKLKEKKLKERKSSLLKSGKPTDDEPLKRRGRTSKKRPREENDVESFEKVVVARTFNGVPIPEEQPILLSGGIMRDYQLKGYEWMATLYENGINGILADEMGLGKTIQTIALFCHLIEMGVPGPFLIVAPLSTISNWFKEFKTFAPEIPVILYHGNQKERELIRRRLKDEKTISCFDPPRKARPVFVTSYEMAMNDRPRFANIKWRYIVVDEGHRLKNMHCRLIRELKQYQASNRLLLTGTPLQNNLDELWSLLNFLMGEIFDDLRVFKSWFNPKDIDESKESEEDRILKQEKQGNILNTLHQILTPFLLRRVKADVDLKIPPKKEVLVYCPMTKKQHEMYEAIVNKTIQELLVKDDFNDENVPRNLNVTNAPRPTRKIAKFDYKSILSLEDLESDKNFEKYLDLCGKMQEAREKKLATVETAYGKNLQVYSRTSDLNYCLKNRMMDLRKCTNHPYLIEYPLTEDGVFYRVDEDLVEICGKIKVLDQMLTALMERKHKVLIFSQMTRMLDIIEDFIKHRGFVASRLDGTMKFEDRQLNIDAFNEDENVRIFLLSTRAGGLGINLTAADTCIIYDSDWNPQQDLQAQDRCHRIGQTKPVMIYRLVTANTIDEKIVERAAAKRKLEKLIIHSKKFKSQDSEGLKKTMEAISPQELLELLNSKDHAGVVNRKDGPVFKPEELELLLDRSDLRWQQQKQLMEDKERVENNLKKKAKLDAKVKKESSSSLFKVIDTEGMDNALPSVRDEIK